jgi:2-methylcitrate dehydratase PrpD
MVNHGVVPGERSSHLTSAPYQVALALLLPEARYVVDHSPADIGADARALMGMITVQADEKLLAHYPRTWPARVVVVTRSARHEKLMLHVPGDAERPFGEHDVADKFARVLSPLLGGEAACALANRSLGVLTGNDAVAQLLAEVDRLCATR